MTNCVNWELGKMRSGVQELLSCVCFGDKKIVCAISIQDDVNVIKDIIKEMLDEYFVSIVNEGDTYIILEETEVIFLMDYNEDNYMTTETYSFIDFKK